MMNTTARNHPSDSATGYRPRLLSSSSLTGDNVVNSQGESLGDIKDFMIDLDTGSIAYAVLSFGGVLGMGDKYFAVPFEALRVDTTHERFVLDVPKERLENAPGFSHDNWPQHADDSFLNEVYNYYGYGNYRDYNERYYGDYSEDHGNYLDRYAPRDWERNTDTMPDRTVRVADTDGTHDRRSTNETYRDRVARSREQGMMNVIDSNRDGV